MSYFEPYIDAEGYHFPTYGELMEYILSQYKKIYGESVYLGNDSQDYQFISIFAKMLYDLFSFFEVILNNQAPSSAVGSGLDMRVAWNGIQRKPASFSTCDLQLGGVVGTVIEGGVARDTGGNLWNLPEKVILTESPLTVSAQSQEIGAVAAPANTINSIVTPVAGWTSVNNELPASTGSAIETDEELKARRIDSVSIVAVNMRDSMKAAILAAENVSKCEIYENDTNITDDNGIPPHSVACVVEGGDSAEIAKIIFNKKGPGTGTYAAEDSAGFVSETVTSSSGLPCTILFCRPVEVNVKIYISITKTPYYNTTTQANIQKKLKEYFSKVALGTDIYASSIIAVASQAINDIYNPEFRLSSTVLMAKNEEELSDRNKIEVKFNETAVLSELTIAGGL